MSNQTSLSRRSLLAGAASTAVSAGLAVAGSSAAAASKPPASAPAARAGNYLTVSDGTVIHYKDWGSGQPVVFSHGWPLQGDAWEDQMFFLASHGYRVIAHDRRGHGLSSQPWNGNDMDHYADDLAALMNHLDLKNAVLVGHSTGGGEVAHYIGRHGSKRVAKAVLVGAVPPQMVKSPANPGGLPIDVFDGIRKSVIEDRSQFFMDLTMPFYGYNRPGAKVSQGVRDTFWAQGMQCGIKNAYDCIKQFSEVDYTPDLKKIDVPVLVVHGSDDQIVPIDASGRAAAKILKNATLLVYEGAPHGLPTTHKHRLNEDLLAFIKA
jgi:non-heme chloroperoxidase